MRRLGPALFLAPLLAFGLYGQSGGDQPSFDVASVKPHVFGNGPSGCGPIRISGPRVSMACFSLRVLIMRAYDVKAYQITGGPSWLNTTGDTAYDIQATVEGGATPTMDQAMVALRGLLADRFELKIHRETKDMPVYALVVGKDGPKFKESAPDARQMFSTRMGGVVGSYRSPKATMAQFALYLTDPAGRPVIDKTGLTGSYDLKLEWTRDQPQIIPGMAPPPADGPAAAEPRAPSLFTALQEQLGLRLESEKAPIDLIVVEHAARPSEN